MNIEEIGEDSNSLLCLTSNIHCCRRRDLWLDYIITFLHWYFPNGSYVEYMDYMYSNSLYRNRGPSVVRLHRRHNAMIPNGIFHCNITNINGTFQNIYVGIYTSENGKLELLHIMSCAKILYISCMQVLLL